MPNFLYQNVPIFPLYILLTRRIETFWSEGIDTFWSGGTGTAWHRKSQTKNPQYSQRSFELYELFMHNFLCHTVTEFPFYILTTYYPNYLLLEKPKFVLLPTPTHLFLTLLILIAPIQFYGPIQTIKSSYMCQYYQLSTQQIKL